MGMDIEDKGKEYKEDEGNTEIKLDEKKEK